MSVIDAGTTAPAATPAPVQTQTVTPPVKFSIDDRVQKLLDDRKAPAAEPATSNEPQVPTEPEATPAATATVTTEPTPAAPATPSAPTVSWRDLPLTDIDNEFLKNKPASELLKSYEASVTQMNKANEKANRLERELQQLRQQQEIDQRVQGAISRVLPQQPAPEPTVSVRDQFRQVLFDDPEKAFDIIDNIITTKAAEIADQKYQQYRSADNAEKIQSNAQDAAARAVERIMGDYGLDEEAASRAVASTFAILAPKAESDPNVWLKPDSYISEVAALATTFGFKKQSTEATVQAAPVIPPTPTVPLAAPTPIATPAQPPGATRPAPIQPPVQPKQSPLSAEAIAIRERLAEERGWKADDLIKRGERSTRKAIKEGKQ